jgi:hypothetical protein
MKIARSPLLLLAMALGASVIACGQKRTQPSPTTAAPVAAPGPADDDVASATEKRPRFGSSAVYVDGKAVGVLTSTEMPLQLKPRVIEHPDHSTTTHYGVLDYLRALKVDTSKIKALHLYGGKRVLIFGHEDLVMAERVAFSFVGVNRGKTRLHLPKVKLPPGNYSIDMLTNVAVYLEKEPPRRDENRDLVMPDGTKVEGKVPYAPEEQGSGTRIYVDGALVGTVKRKKITNDILVAPADTGGDDGKANANAKLLPSGASPDTLDRFSLLGYATKFSAAAAQVKSADVVSGDDVIGHLTPAELRALTFNVPARNRGQAVVYLSQSNGKDLGSLRKARVSAIQIYVNSTPPERSLVAIDDAIEAKVGQSRGGSDSTNEL